MPLQRRVAPRGVTAVGLALAGLALAGCGERGTFLPSGLDQGDGYGKPVGGVPPTAAPGNGVPGNGAAVAVTSLRVASAGPLGQVVVDNEGRVLYRFARDRPRPSASTCSGECTQVWPPVRWNPQLRIAGDIQQARVGRFRRPDGTFQLTLAGWPLYRYSRDTAPLDANGQGVAGGWAAARPDGTPAAFTAGIPAPPGYGEGTGGVVSTEAPSRQPSGAPPG